MDWAFDNATFGLDSAQHGRFLWDSIAYGTVDFDVDDPMMVFTGDPYDSCDATYTTTYGGDMDDVYLAEWDTTYAEWNVQMTGTYDECPDPKIVDHHDPAAFGLPDDVFKVFAQDGSTASQQWRIYYGGRNGWEATPGEVRLCYDTGTDPCGTSSCVSALPEMCAEDVEYFFSDSGSGPANEGVFFLAQESGVGICTSGGVSTTPGIVFAERQN